MNKYTYQFWSRGYRELKSEEDTLYYYSIKYKSPNSDKEKFAKKLLKNCKSSEDWAKYAYENKLQFCVCKMNEGTLEATLRQDTINDITIAFYDEYKRLFMYYVFREQENGMLFCVGMMFWEFIEGLDGDDDDTKSWIYTFETNGNVKVIEHEKGAEEECIWTSKIPLNVQNNWEPKPKFGEWDSLFRMKRWRPGELDEAFKGVPDGSGIKK